MATIDCICPPKADGEARHANDTVTFKASLGFVEATAIRKKMTWGAVESDDDQARGALALAYLVEAYLLFGIESWTLVDAKGKPVPVSHAAIREHILSNPLVAGVLGDEADELYNEVILLPLLARGSTSSPATPTRSTPSPAPESTSAPTASPTPLRKPSKRSSTTTSPTAATATISGSPDGDSSSSPNSASAA